MTIDPLARHLAHLRMRSFQPATVSITRRVLSHFARTIEPRDLLEATRYDVEAFLSRDIAPGTRRVYRSRIRGFYLWCIEEELVQVSPAGKIPPIKVAKGLPRPISTEQLSAALEGAGPRMRAWLVLMALGGLRCLEVAALRPGDLVATDSGPVLRLRVTKGGGQGMVPAHPRIVECLRYLPVRDGAWWDCGPVSVSRQVAEHMRRSGINGTAHQLRHYAGTTWYEASGHDLLTTARLLRHSDVSSTQTYAQISPARPTEVVGAVTLGMPA